MKRLFAIWMLLAVAASAWALPSVDAVQAEVQRGNYAQAETMMREVVDAKPGSAKAHYIYAEILAHNARFDRAAEEARLAKQIEPSLGFTQPEKFRAFEQLLEREQRDSRAANTPATRNPAPSYPVETAAHPQRSSVPGWLWGAGLAVVAVLLWRAFSARQSARAAYPVGPAYPAGGAGMAGYGPSYGPAGGPMSGGSGMLGTGIAAAGGFAAGMLAEKLFDGRNEHVSSNADVSSNGYVPGMFDDAPARNPAADELEQRNVDFGSGDDWGGGGADDSSSDDGW